MHGIKHVRQTRFHLSNILLIIVLDKKTFHHEPWHFISVNRKIRYTIPIPQNFAKVDFTIKWNIVSLQIDVMTSICHKYQVNNTVMFNNLFCRFWQVINLVKKDQHSLKSCVDLFLFWRVFEKYGFPHWMAIPHMALWIRRAKKWWKKGNNS
jgi:hypothetical protein